LLLIQMYTTVSTHSNQYKFGWNLTSFMGLV